LFISVHRSELFFERFVIIEDIGGRLDKGVAPFCRGSTTARDHICDLDIVVVECDGTHSEVEVAMVDEDSVFGRFAIKLGGFGKLWFFTWRCGGSLWSLWFGFSRFSKLPDSVSELYKLLLDLRVGDHDGSGLAKRGDDKRENEDVASVVMWEAIKTVTEGCNGTMDGHNDVLPKTGTKTMVFVYRS
jgi:hypothetical protein